MSPARLFFVLEVLLSQEVPSEEVRMVPESPTVTKVLFPWVIPKSCCHVPEVLSDQVVTSVEVRMVPLSPTVTESPFP